LLEKIDNPERKRIVRADHGKIDMILFGESSEAGQIVRANRHIVAEVRSAGVTRRAKDLVGRGRLFQLPGQRVFTATAADNKDFHSTAILEAATSAANVVFIVVRVERFERTAVRRIQEHPHRLANAGCASQRSGPVAAPARGRREALVRVRRSIYIRTVAAPSPCDISKTRLSWRPELCDAAL
jgi:hypothetical protein